MISALMRDMLIDHLDDKKVRVVEPGNFAGLDASKAAIRVQTTNALIARGWVRAGPGKHPRFTIITDAGRAALAKLLAEYADALTRAGYRAEERASSAGQTLPPTSGLPQRTALSENGSPTPGMEMSMSTNAPGPTETTTAS
jgi:hypothetical protein